MKEGNTIYFSCKTDRRWLVNPSGNKLFSVREDEKGPIKDSQRGQRIKMQVEGTKCGITISYVTRADCGQFIYLMFDGKFSTNIRSLSIEVGSSQLLTHDG